MFKWAFKKIFKLLLIIGAALIISAFISNISLNSFMEHAAETTAVIDQIEGSRPFTGEPNVTVDYMVGDTHYDNKKLKYYSEDMNEGDTITILYNTDYPKNMRAKDAESPVKKLYTWGFVIVFGSLALNILLNFLEKKRIQKKAERKAEKKYAKQQASANSKGQSGKKR